MPTYVYRRADGTTFEHFQRISDDALTEDPETGEPIERLVGGGAGLIFKGSGFYLTDYARKKTSGGGQVTSDNGPGSESPKSESKGEGKVEKKTEKKAPSKPAASGD